MNRLEVEEIVKSYFDDSIRAMTDLMHELKKTETEIQSLRERVEKAEELKVRFNNAMDIEEFKKDIKKSARRFATISINKHLKKLKSGGKK